MKTFRAGLFGLAFLLLLASSVLAGGRGYYYPRSTYYPSTNCYPQSYCYTSVTYSAWSYWVYPATEYYYRVRYRYEGYSRYLEDDGWLYVYAGGYYKQHCKIADFVAKPVAVLQPTAKLYVPGQTEYGTDAMSYAVAKTYGPKIASLLTQQGVPTPVDVAALLPPVETRSLALQESVVKQATSASEIMAQVLAAEQHNERLKIEARRDVALQSNKFQAFERMLGKFGELDAVMSQQAAINTAAFAQQIPVSDPALAQIIAVSCFSCHGGNKVEADLDFKLAASFDTHVWRKIRNQVISGRMPKGGQPLDEATQEIFEGYYDRIREAARAPAR